MRTALIWSIKIFWVFVGCRSVWILACMGREIIFARYPIGLPDWALFLAGLFFFAAITFAAWSAVFRFSLGTLGPLVFIVTFVMWSVAMHGIRVDFVPILERDMKFQSFSPMSFIILLLYFVTVAGSFKFYRFTLKAVEAFLFPSLRHSAAQIF